MTAYAGDEILNNAAQLASQLLRALKDEHEALTGNQVEPLVTALERKHQAIAEIRQAEQQISGRDWQRLREDPGRRVEWDAFSSLMSQCRRQNEINGRIIHMRQQSTLAALSILRGQEHAPHTAYDAKGRPLSSPPPSRIASA